MNAGGAAITDGREPVARRAFRAWGVMVPVSFLSRECLNHAEEALIRAVEALSGTLRAVICDDRAGRETVRAVIPLLRIIDKKGPFRMPCSQALIAC